MAELYQQLAFINAILGGFTITFLSVLLSAPNTRIVDWIIGVTTTSAVSFILSALGATFGAVVVGNTYFNPTQLEGAGLHQLLSLLFLGGTVLLFTALGLSGWMRSRKSGITTTTIATAALVCGIFILNPFIY